MYSPSVGFIYVFNLIVGTGALALPKAMSSAGWLVSIILLAVLGIISYITTTFVIESLSIANACIRHNKREHEDEDNNPVADASDSDSSSGRTSRTGSGKYVVSENAPLLNNDFGVNSGLKYVKPYNRRRANSLSNRFAIHQTIEMGQMADMFFNPFGRILFYICIIVYLYGDLAIYAAAVPKSLRDIVCSNITCASTNSSYTPSDSDPCLTLGKNISRMDAYRIFLAVFTVALCPFAYFNVQKTKYLQYMTTVFRWAAFITMITLASLLISQKGSLGHPPTADIYGIPNLFGVSVYSFMCQHSLPSLVTPIKNKQKLTSILAADYICIFLFYVLLGLTAIFCFTSDQLKDIYTLNFVDTCEATDITFVRYFLGLFPVVTLSTSFPIIAVTLRNNLKALFKPSTSFIINRLLFPTLAIGPPIVAAFITNNVTVLVGFTGSYAGAAVQYFIPAFLVLLARKEISRIHGLVSVGRNPHRSPFYRRIWIIIVVLWAIICLVLVTTNYILSGVSHHKNSTFDDFIEMPLSRGFNVLTHQL